MRLITLAIALTLKLGVGAFLLVNHLVELGENIGRNSCGLPNANRDTTTKTATTIIINN